MNKISTYNYEEWVLDYVEGKLNLDEVSELRAFLVLHPRLQSELLAFENVQLDSVSVQFENKNALKKPMILDNYLDEQCVAYSEGDLINNERILFEEQLVNDSTLMGALQLLSKAKLQPDSSVVFEGKRTLKHYQLANRKVVLYATSVAASITLLLGAYFMFKTTNAEVKLSSVTTVQTPINVSVPIAKLVKTKNKRGILMAMSQKPFIREEINIEAIQKPDLSVITEASNQIHIEKIDTETLLALEPPVEEQELKTVNPEPSNDNNYNEASETLIAQLAEKGLSWVGKRVATKLSLKKENDTARNATIYKFNSNWVSVYAYVNNNE